MNIPYPFDLVKRITIVYYKIHLLLIKPHTYFKIKNYYYKKSHLLQCRWLLGLFILNYAFVSSEDSEGVSSDTSSIISSSIPSEAM